MEKTKTFSTYNMALIAIMAAITCILGPLSINIPISPVPITLTNLAIYFTVCILGWKLGTISLCIYLLIGMVGLPVFSNFSGGFAKLAGPTGGYLIGFIFLAMIAGYFFDHFDHPALFLVGMILGTAVCYLFGTAWLCFQAHLTLTEGLWMGVIPYIPGDLVKMLLALFLAPILKKRIQATGLL